MGSLTSKTSVEGKGEKAVETSAMQEARKHMTLGGFIELLAADYGGPEMAEAMVDRVRVELAALEKVLTDNPTIIPAEASEDFYHLFFHINTMSTFNPDEYVVKMYIRSIESKLGAEPKDVAAKIQQIALLIDKEVAAGKPPATAKHKGKVARVGRFGDYVDDYYYNRVADISEANRVDDDSYSYYDGYYDDNYGGNVDLFKFDDRSRAGNFAGYGHADYHHNKKGGLNRLHRSRTRDRNFYGRRQLQDVVGDIHNSDDLDILPLVLVSLAILLIALIFIAYRYRKNNEYKMKVLQVRNIEEGHV